MTASWSDRQYCGYDPAMVPTLIIPRNRGRGSSDHRGWKPWREKKGGVDSSTSQCRTQAKWLGKAAGGSTGRAHAPGSCLEIFQSLQRRALGAQLPEYCSVNLQIIMCIPRDPTSILYADCGTVNGTEAEWSKGTNSFLKEPFNAPSCMAIEYQVV